ncbi:MAG: T9SS type A sorting domain-containing protein [Bacteroidota bacterium]
MKKTLFLFVLLTTLLNVKAQTIVRNDSTFGFNGKVISDIGSNEDECFSLALQPDGKLIIAGSNGYSSLLARINPVGSLDTSFNHTGKIISSIPASAQTILLREDNKIMVVGLKESNTVGCAQYTIEGNQDIIFGDSGYVITDIGQEIYPVSAAIQNDGKILAFGTTSTRLNTDGTIDLSFGTAGKKVSDFTVWNGAVTESGEIYLVGANGNVVLQKLKNDGSPDSTFNGTGKVVVNPDGGGGAGYDILLLPDHKILTCGIAWGKIFIMRHNPDGRIDSTFGNKGITTTIISDRSSGKAICLQPDGKILITGYAGNGATYGSVLARYTSDGILDATFNQTGYVLTYFGRDNNGAEVVVQPDGKIIMAGTSDRNFVFTRLNTNGTLDSSFGLGGYFSFSFRGWEEAYEVALDSKNRIVTLGPGIVSRNNYDGKQDISFDQNGRLIERYCGITNGDGALAIQNDNSIIIGGSYNPSYNNRVFRLVRYLENGTLDVTFGNNGLVSTSFNNEESVNAIAVQPDGKIIAAGQTRTPNTNNYAFALARYNTDGSLDNSFDSDGKVITNVGGYNGANSVKIQPDGKIIAAGYADNNFAIIRYNINGSLDLSFDSDGIAITDFGSDGYESATAIAIQKDGKILAAGKTRISNTNNYAFALSRYYTDGSPDISFGDSGKVLSAVESNGGVQSMVIQKDGKIIVAGVGLAINNSSPDIVSVRYKSTGSIDSTYGESGVLITDFGGNGYKVSAVIQNESKLVIAGTSEGYFALARYILFNNPDNISEEKSLLSVFPNPTQGNITIGFPEPGTVDFIDLFGRTIKSVKLTGNRSIISISEFIPGIYTVRIKTSNGIATQKILKL